MKTTIKLGNIKFKGIEINNIEFTEEYTLNEVIGLVRFGKQFVEEIIEENPQIIESLSEAFNNKVDSNNMSNELKKFIREINKENNKAFNMSGINRRGY